MIEHSYNPIEPALFAGTMVPDELSSTLAVISAIPDGLSLRNFPYHLDAADCWCRPEVTLVADTLILNHKDLDKGEFDC
jgi:hypothetical protein